MVVEVTYSTSPVIILSKGFEEGIENKDVWAGEVVREYKFAVVHVSVGSTNADELDGNAVRLEGGDWVGSDLGLDLIQIAHGKLGGAF